MDLQFILISKPFRNVSVLFENGFPLAHRPTVKNGHFTPILGWVSRKRRTIPFRVETWVPGHLGQPFRDPYDCKGFKFRGPMNGTWPHLRKGERGKNARKAIVVKGESNRGEFYSHRLRILYFFPLAFFPRRGTRSRIFEKKKKKTLVWTKRKLGVRRNVQENSKKIGF